MTTQIELNLPISLLQDLVKESETIEVTLQDYIIRIIGARKRPKKPTGVKPSILVGSTYRSSRDELVTVIEYTTHSNIMVRFEDGTEKRTTATCLQSGNIRNPNACTIQGVGKIGIGKWSSKRHPREYTMWASMFTRVRDEGFHLIDTRWYNFQTFCQDISSMENYDKIEEKSTMFSNRMFDSTNKLWAPHTCKFTTRSQMARHLGFTVPNTQHKKAA